MAGNYTGTPTAVQAPGAAPSLSGYPISSIPADGDALASASIAQALKEPLDFIAYLQDRFRDLIFGNASDGGQVVSAPATLNATVFASTWTATSSTLNVTGWPVIARTSISFSNCTVNGSAAAANGITPTGYGTGTTAGPHGCPVVSRTSISAANSFYTQANFIAFGGAGGSPTGGAGPFNTVISPGSQYKQYPYRFANAPQVGIDTSTLTAGGLYPTNVYDAIRGGTAGINGTGSSSTGGAGGGGGALVVLIAPTITLTNVTFTSNGGAGGTPPSGNANGGCGGGGGAFLFICQTLNQSGCTFTANGGAAGTGVGTGVAGTAGAAGNTTPYVVLIP